jgi:NTE family protein
MTADAEDLIGLVLSGAGARGAYEAGAVACLLPELQARGARPTIFLGTSAGAINVAALAQFADLPAAEAAEELLRIWRDIDHRAVWAPLLKSGPRLGLRHLAGRRVTSLLDTRPIVNTVRRLFDGARLSRNIAGGIVDALGVVSTLCADDISGGRTRLFVQSQGRLPKPDPDSGIDIISTPIAADHLLASSAIPILFPPAKVTQPPEAAGWYMDGGIRLNTPLLPAIKLGARRLIIISSHATSYSAVTGKQRDSKMPTVEDAGALALHSLMADELIEDLHTLRRTNRFLKVTDEAAVRAVDGHRYRIIPHITVSPPPGVVARAAHAVFDPKYKRPVRPRSLDFWLMNRVLGGGEGLGNHELLSYLLFDPDYFNAQFELGRRHAAEALAAGWQT